MENWRHFLNEGMNRPADLPDGLKVIIRPDDKFVWFEIVDETPTHYFVSLDGAAPIRMKKVSGK